MSTVIPLVGDLHTHFTDRPRVVMVAPPRGADGVAITDFDVIEAGMRAGVQVALWPSRTPVPGRWEVVHEQPNDYTMDMRFIRDGEAGSEWEAVIVDRVAIAARLPGIDTSEPTAVARYSPASRPFVGSAISTPFEGGSLFGIQFSELIGISETAHPFVRLDAAGTTAGCAPRHPSNSSVTSALNWQCGPIADGDRIVVHIDGALTATAGGTIAYAYSRPPGSEVTLDLTLRRDPGAGTDEPLTADRAVLEMATGVTAVTP